MSLHSVDRTTKKVWKLLKQKLQLAKTHPRIIAIIGHVIYRHHCPNIQELIETDTNLQDDLINQAVQEQHSIG